MNKNDKIVLAVAAAYCATGVTVYVAGRIRHKKAMDEIDAETARELAAISHAGETVRARINSGHRYPSIVDVMNDFNFERITARFND